MHRSRLGRPWPGLTCSGAGACVEVADLAAGVAVRDSENPDGPKSTHGPTSGGRSHGR
ncbi:DUF397 domain-containing protein [Actinomadura miaoliensis]|uniref:DUF397 domain-containing protein n=1 Tax=Actinomadura miaoliensis TaxID=430685 RepID=UPI0031EFCBE9